MLASTPPSPLPPPPPRRSPSSTSAAVYDVYAVPRLRPVRRRSFLRREVACFLRFSIPVSRKNVGSACYSRDSGGASISSLRRDPKRWVLAAAELFRLRIFWISCFVFFFSGGWGLSCICSLSWDSIGPASDC